MSEQSPIDERPSAVAALFVRHPLWEDALALLFGTALVALGIAFYAHAGLLTGGTVGITRCCYRFLERGCSIWCWRSINGRTATSASAEPINERGAASLETAPRRFVFAEARIRSLR
ncbi:hypothetical protein C5L43_18020 [Ectopseudomonas oleovorans]|nr:hypothetical protein C5L43_18020 [Pseudomonas oleovorans]